MLEHLQFKDVADLHDGGGRRRFRYLLLHLWEDPAHQPHNFRLLLNVQEAFALENLCGLLMSVGRSLPDNVVGFAAGLVVRRDLIWNWLIGWLSCRLSGQRLLSFFVRVSSSARKGPKLR